MKNTWFAYESIRLVAFNLFNQQMIKSAKSCGDIGSTMASQVKSCRTCIRRYPNGIQETALLTPSNLDFQHSFFWQLKMSCLKFTNIPCNMQISILSLIWRLPCCYDMLHKTLNRVKPMTIHPLQSQRHYNSPGWIWTNKNRGQQHSL